MTRLKRIKSIKKLLNICLILCLFVSFLITSRPVLATDEVIPNDSEFTSIVDIDENGDYIYYDDIYTSLLVKSSSIPKIVLGLGHYKYSNYDSEKFFSAEIANKSYDLALIELHKQNPDLNNMNFYYFGTSTMRPSNYGGTILVKTTVFASPNPIQIYYTSQRVIGSEISNQYSLTEGFYIQHTFNTQWEVSTAVSALNKPYKDFISSNHNNTGTSFYIYHEIIPSFKYLYGSTMSNAFYGDYSIVSGSISPPIINPNPPILVPFCSDFQVPNGTNNFYYLDELPTIDSTKEFKKVCKFNDKEVYQLVDKVVVPPGPDEPGGDGGWLQPLFDFFNSLFAPLLTAVSKVAQSVLEGIGNITIPLNYEQLPEQIKGQVSPPKARFGIVLVPIGILILFILGGVTGLLDFSKLTIPISNLIDYFFKKINDPLAPAGSLSSTTQFSLDVRNSFNNLFGSLTSIPNLLKNFIDSFSNIINAAIVNSIGVDLSKILKLFDEVKKFVEQIPIYLTNIRDAVLGIPLSIAVSISGALGDMIDGSTLLSSIRDTVLGFPQTLGSIKDTLLGIPSILQQLLDKFLEFLSAFSIANLISAFQNMLKALFIPSDGYFSSTFEGLMNKFNLKLPIIGDVASLISSLMAVMFNNYSNEPPKFTIKVPKELGLGEEEYTVIDWQFYSEYRSVVHGIILLIFYGFAILGLPKKLSNVLGGIN